MCDDLVVRHATHRVHDEDRVRHRRIGPIQLAAVMDGHGGATAVQRVDQELERVDAVVDDLEEAARALCRRLAVTVEHERPGLAIALWLLDTRTHEWVCANVGDVVGVHVRPTTHLMITTNHRLQHNPEERARATRRGGRIEQSVDERGVRRGPVRLWPGGLAMSRSFGDADAPHRSTEPSVCHGTLRVDEDVVVLMTDGVYDALPTEQVVSLLRSGRSIESVLERAVRAGGGDDASLLVVRGAPEPITPRSCVPLFRRSPSTSPTVSPTSSSGALDALDALGEDAVVLPVAYQNKVKKEAQ